ncbi:class I SAM-dependent methyltransferase [Phormidium tenue]|uniref:SAM-dependent methyltransferase n=1 Tax=Phormidium tenue NIES-30 TaxID=549789 RepID=A0A1U7J0S4_9CYAN|nr:class I SAM-dependent methyltransferase [Phormidium tenue]MBD2234008.1 class I SAM-dependent methyltransferase [Phormidium tenue FACHB-1052]OKH45383.1 SAM-dependent methyltransferase [Phormidium tenue NIES-30]
MTATSAPNLLSSVVNQVLAVKPLWNFAKGRARHMMVTRAETIGVPWRERVQALRSRRTGVGDAEAGPSTVETGELSPLWQADLESIQNPHLVYPSYYTTSFHAYDEGNLGWQPAMEVEVAAQAVHAKIWPEAGAAGDDRLRQSYHDVLIAQLPQAPEAVVDIGCGVGMSTEAFQTTFPQARLTGVDLSPYFLAVAQYRQHERQVTGKVTSTTTPITWHHGAGEATGLPAAAYDLVSICLVCHELPQSATKAVMQEARRLLRPGGHLAIMDMNPRSEAIQKLPPFVFTLLKSTEPYLDDYFTLDMEAAFEAAGFERPTVTFNSPRHRTFIGKAL